MQARTGWGVIGLASLTWLACVGEDPQPSAPSNGGVDERCLDNGTCNTGLSCVDGRCQVATSEGSSDSGEPTKKDKDSGTKVPDDKSDAGACVLLDDQTTDIQCGGTTCSEGAVCCKGNSAVGCSGESGCPEQDVVWSCEDKQDCQFGSAFCCVSGTPTDDTACSSAVENGRSVCRFDFADCAAPTDFIACTSADECSSQKCEPMEVRTTGGFTVVIKVCRP